MQPEISKRTILVATAKGGTLNFLSSDGEVLYNLPVTPGKHLASEFLDLLPQGGSIEVQDGIAVIDPPSAWNVQRPDIIVDETNGEKIGDCLYDSGANPHFIARTTSEKMAEKMRLDMSKLSSLVKTAEARERAIKKIERIPSNPDAEVIEDSATPPEKPAEPPKAKPATTTAAKTADAV